MPFHRILAVVAFVGALTLAGCIGVSSDTVSSGPAVPQPQVTFPVQTKVVEMATQGAPTESGPAATAPSADAGQSTMEEKAPARGKDITAETVKGVTSTALTLPEWSDFLLWPGNDLLYAFAPASKTIYPVDPRTGQLGETIQLDLPGFLLAVQPDLSLVVIQNEQGKIAVHAVAPGGSASLVRDFGLTASAASFTRDGKIMAVPGEGEQAVTLYDVQSGAMITKLTGFETPGPVFTAVITPDGKAVVWRSRNSVQIQNAATGELLPLIKTDGFINELVISPDSTQLAVATGDQLLVYAIADGQQAGSFALSQSAASLAFSPDGSLVAAGYGTAVQLWDIAGKLPLEPVSGHIMPVAKVGFSPDGQYLISLDQNLEMRIWQVK